MRLSEQYSLTWEQIDFARKEINLEQTKNGSARSIPMDRDVLHAFEILHEMDRPTSPSSRVFPIQSPRYWFARISHKRKLPIIVGTITDIHFISGWQCAAKI
jgi:integrase